MNQYIKRSITAILCFLIILIFNFLLPRMLPGDPVAYLSGEEGLTAVQYEYYYNALHLNENLLVQFGYYLKDIFSGTLGYSYQHSSAVSSLIGKRIGLTLLITVPSVLISSGLGLFLGLYSGYHRGSLHDHSSSTLQAILSALPSFLIAFLLIILFGINGKLPYSGISSIGMEKTDKGYYWDCFLHIILPILTLVISITPSRYLMVRNQTAKEMTQKYVLFARQRGISKWKIQYKYIFPNIAAPFIHMVGMSVGICIGGSVVVEMIFSIPGMGMLLSQAVNTLDYPLLQGILFITTLLMTILIVSTDILCICIDPRQRRKKYED